MKDTTVLEGNSALHIAAVNDNVSTVKTLLKVNSSFARQSFDVVTFRFGAFENVVVEGENYGNLLSAFQGANTSFSRNAIYFLNLKKVI